MSSLAAQFISILEAPDYSAQRRRELMLVFAHANKAEIAEGLTLRNRDLISDFEDNGAKSRTGGAA